MALPTLQMPSFSGHGGLPLSSFPINAALDDVAAMVVVASMTLLFLLRGIVWDRADPFLYKLYERPQESMLSKSSTQGSRNIAEKLDQLGADLVIFWGSQSGTAERFANRLSKEIRQRFGKKALAADPSDYDATSIASIPQAKLAIFIVSTFGEGEPSDNVHELWSHLESAKGSTLDSLRYICFGLGNSNYKYYNAVVDIIAERLDALGATSLLPIGKADDAKGLTEEHYLEWKLEVFALLKTSFGFEERDPLYEPSLSVVNEPGSETVLVATHNGQPMVQSNNRKASRIMSPAYSLPVKVTKELFEDTTNRNCVHMEIDLNEQPTLKYKTGDHLGVWPTNPQVEVELLTEVLGLGPSRDSVVKVSAIEAETKLKVPTKTSIAGLFSNYLEICAPVSREAIASLVEFAPSPSAKQLLLQLGNDKGTYEQLLAGRYVNLGRLLRHIAPEAAAWKGLPLSLVIELLPAMQPRYYSISSSSVVHPRQVAITAVVADKPTGSSALIPGLCTNHLLAYHRASLANAGHEARLYAHVRKSTFKLPALPSQPIIMVAAGTGIAPFRGFLQERERLAKMGRPIGRSVLFLGCRNEAQDFLYADELRHWEKLPEMNFSIVTAFSRPDTGKKVYVQKRIIEHADEVCKLVLESNANFYICGSAAMARDVSGVLGAELQSRRGWDDEVLRAFFETQKRTRRWQQDVWG